MVDSLPSPFDPDRMRPASNGSGTFGAMPPPAGGYVPPRPLTVEYISGEYGPYQGAYYRSLPRWIDDISRDFPDVYEQMLLDDQVSACTRTIVESVLADDLTLRPAVDDKDDPDYDTAKTVLEFCERSLGNLPRSIEDWLREMLVAVALGNRVSEQVYRVEESGLDAGRLVLDRLKVKPRKHTGFVIDVYANLVGILGWVPGMPNWSGTVALGDLATVPNLLPRDKFAILVHSPQDEDPRGTSILRAAYRSWWQKLQCMADWLKHLGQFGSPSLLGICAPDAITQPAADSQGNPIVGGIALSPAQQMVNELLRFRNGYALAVPNGADVRLLQSAPTKGAFTEAIDYHDRAIARAILLASRVTMEAEHGSKADSETAQDVTGAAIKRRKSWAAWMVTHDVLMPLVRYNFGADIANRLCPRATLTAVEHQDWTQNASAVAQLASVGFLQKQQWPALYEKLGLPPADAPPEEEAQTPAPAAAEGEQPAESAQPAADFANLPQPYQEGKHPRGYHGRYAGKPGNKETGKGYTKKQRQAVAAYLAENGPATEGELVEHLYDAGTARKEGPAVVRALVAAGVLRRGTDAYGREAYHPAGETPVSAATTTSPAAAPVPPLFTAALTQTATDLEVPARVAQTMGDASKRVFARMSDGARQRIEQHVKRVAFHENVLTMLNAIEAEAPEMARETHREEAYGAGGCMLGGTYGSLHIVAGYQGMTPTVQGTMPALGERVDDHLLAHELGHAIDGPTWEYSRSWQWTKAWNAEIGQQGFLGFKRAKEAQLTEYARTSPQEGFAEFSRLLHAADMPRAEVEVRFPKCVAFWKERGLWA